MARSRNIKPAIMDNEELAELDPIDRLLFIYLWMLADREGRLEDRPKRIAKQALAYDRDADADEIIKRLAGAGFLQRYSWAGVPYLQITNFVKHQAPHGTEKDSLIPDAAGFLIVHQRGKNGYSTGLTSLVSCSLTVKDGSPTPSTNSASTVENSSPASTDNSSSTVSDPMSEGGQNSLIPDSGFLIPDSNTPQPPKGVRRRRISATNGPEGFDEFWDMYPRKDAKQDAMKAWRQLHLSEDADQRPPVMAGLAAWTQHEQWTRESGKFIPLPASWLRGLRWTDDCVKSAVAATGTGVSAWWQAAGFPNVFEAENSGCWEHTAAQFRNGERVTEGAEA